MKLINITRLSDAELRYMAEQEDIEDADSLDRNELIESLEEIYENDSSELMTDKKYVNSLTSKETDTEPLPGVRPLPEKFNENGIQTILKDSEWAYVIWRITTYVKSKILEGEPKVILEVVALKEKGKEEKSYQVEVGPDDTEWNIEFPWKDRSYVIHLKAVIDGELQTLATSAVDVIPGAYLEENPLLLKNPETYKIFSAPLVTNGGEYLDVNRVKDLLSVSLN